MGIKKSYNSFEKCGWEYCKVVFIKAIFYHISELFVNVIIVNEKLACDLGKGPWSKVKQG